MIDLGNNDIERLRLSVQSFGFGFLSGSIVPTVLRGLQEEAEKCVALASRAELSEDLKYSANIASLGPRARDFLCGRQMLDLLSTIFGERFVLTEQRSCLTFYKEGDHLGPHLDRPEAECVVTIIVCVEAIGPVPRPPRTGLELRVFGQEMPRDGNALLTIPTHSGRIVIGRGSKFWHERPKLEKGEKVAALTGCYGYATRADDIVDNRTPSSEVSDDSGASSEKKAR